MLSTVVCFAFIATVSATIVPPIPTLSEDQGIRYPLNATSRGKVKIEAFIELLCPDSRAAYPVLKRVAEHYGEENVELVFHQMTLPYHRNAFIATQGLFVIEEQMPDKVHDYMGYIMENLFLLSGTIFLNDIQVLDDLAVMANIATGIDPDLFKAQINRYGGMAVRIWKFAARRGVAGTPWFFVNGIDTTVNPDERLSFEDWTRFIDPLIGA